MISSQDIMTALNRGSYIDIKRRSGKRVISISKRRRILIWLSRRVEKKAVLDFCEYENLMEEVISKIAAGNGINYRINVTRNKHGHVYVVVRKLRWYSMQSVLYMSPRHVQRILHECYVGESKNQIKFT